MKILTRKTKVSKVFILKNYFGSTIVSITKIQAENVTEYIRDNFREYKYVSKFKTFDVPNHLIISQKDVNSLSDEELFELLEKTIKQCHTNLVSKKVLFNTNKKKIEWADQYTCSFVSFGYDGYHNLGNGNFERLPLKSRN